MEMIIATVLVSLGLLAYGSFTGNLVVKNTAQERKTLATTFAQEQLENLKNAALNAALATSASSFPTAHASFTDVPSGGNGIFTRNWWILNGGAGNLSTIIVRVNWDDINGSQNVTLGSMLAQ